MNDHGSYFPNLNNCEIKTIYGSWGRGAGGRGRGILPYMGYIGMCGPKGYGFSPIVVINRVSILADFGHFGHKQGMVFAL